MSSVMSADRSRNRRERTFVGSECAVCEEPLEHTLRGERILQFSCQHVSHEACFYEFIREFESQYCPSCNAPLHLDTSRGGNVLDIGKNRSPNYDAYAHVGTDEVPDGAEKITNMVRSASSSDVRSQITPTPTPSNRWDEPARAGAPSIGRDSATRGSVRSSRDAQSSMASRHMRSDSEATGVTSSAGYAETTQSGPPRRHDYDLQAMETTPSSPQRIARNPIPAPTVTVRSEFPTISKSRTQQTVTCLITVEVSDSKWRPDPEDLGPVASAPRPRAVEEAFAQRPPSPTKSNKPPRFYPYESPETLQEMTENLHSRVDNWHGLDFNR
jgi:hypothetical protein